MPRSSCTMARTRFGNIARVSRMSFVLVRLSVAGIVPVSIRPRQLPMAKAIMTQAASPKAHARCGEKTRADRIGGSSRLRRATIRRGNISKDASGISGSRAFFKMDLSSALFMGKIFQQAFQFLPRRKYAPRNGGFGAAQGFRSLGMALIFINGQHNGGALF